MGLHACWRGLGQESAQKNMRWRTNGGWRISRGYRSLRQMEIQKKHLVKYKCMMESRDRGWAGTGKHQLKSV